MEPRGRILVLGTGTVGAAVTAFLAEERRRGADVEVVAADEAGDEAALARAAALEETGAEVLTGVSAVEGPFDLVVVSPGISPRQPLMVSAAALGVPMISDIDLAYRFARAPFVAVTGTNGKTTVTCLIGHLLRESGVAAELVGNIGRPPISLVREAGPGTVLVAEVSSFQLSTSSAFHPRVAVLLNVTPDHLDWHGTLEAYTADKGRVFDNLTSADLAVLDMDDPGAAAFEAGLVSRGLRICRVSLRSATPGGAWLEDGMLVVDRLTGPMELVRADALQLRGDHNLSNALAACAVALEMGADAESVRVGLRSFEPIGHRLEPVGVVAGVEYIDDSKATNPDAVIKALSAFDEGGIVLLLGGRGKGTDLGPMAAAAAARCSAVITFGEAREDLAAAFEGSPVRRLLVRDSLRDAVDAGYEIARPGDVVLLSPACASFDEFDGYAARGRAFGERVAYLAGQW
ncbi:MAG: UDP-N-acetylmuramoyl-L-alanine--D-glutamate ligase [Coriobacteriia bacterium]